MKTVNLSLSFYCIVMTIFLCGCGVGIRYQSKHNFSPHQSIESYQYVLAHPDNPRVEGQSINQIIEGVATKYGFSILNFSDLTKAQRDVAKKTLIARWRETGRRTRMVIGYSIEITVVLSDYLTGEVIYTGIGEHMGDFERDDYKGAITAALEGLSKRKKFEHKIVNGTIEEPKVKKKSRQTQQDYRNKIRGKRWAVIIGISNYHDSRIPSLRYASSDAHAFYNWIVSQNGGKLSPSRVKFLLNEEATGIRIKEAFYEWLKQALEEDIVIIYFAGHGSPESPDSLDNLFLLPYDARYDSIATSGFPMWDIETALKRFIKAKKVIIIADACHSGGVSQEFDIARRDDRGIKINPISSGIQALSKIGDGICVISASDFDQLSQESQKWGGGHGVFTYYLLKGLNGEADYNKDYKVTLGEIIPYLSEQVRRGTKNSQSPTVAGKFDPALSIGW